MEALTYQESSRRFLENAGEQLAAGDLQQASEKGWGAAAQMVKAVSDDRGWQHSRHRHYLQTIGRLRSETGDGELRPLWNSASALHENALDAYEIEEALGHVRELTLRLAALLPQT